MTSSSSDSCGRFAVRLRAEELDGIAAASDDVESEPRTKHHLSLLGLLFHSLAVVGVYVDAVDDGDDGVLSDDDDDDDDDNNNDVLDV